MIPPSRDRSTEHAIRSLCIAAVITSLCGCGPALTRDNRLMMGTFVEVVSPEKRAPEIVFSELRRIESLLSKYDPASEVSRLNAAGTIKAGSELLDVILQAKRFWEKSYGAFDITVGPLMDIWGFTDKKYRVPSDKEIAAALKSVGSNKIIVDGASGMIQFSVKRMKIDLGGIAKGYALDRAAAELKKAGIEDCLINLGGQIYALGSRMPAPSFNPFGLIKPQPWRVAVKAPRGGGLSRVVTLKNQSIATSGDYEQFFVVNGRRYSHIMDPRTGRPVRSRVAAVTVVAPDAATADALSTACFVMGKPAAQNMARRFDGVSISVAEMK